MVLASASPRRRDLLRAAGVRFELAPSHVNEDLPPGVEPREAAESLAQRKALAAVRDGRHAHAYVLGADTVVAVPGTAGFDLLGKPDGPLQARAMLERLSGSRHQVLTGVAVVAPGAEGRALLVDSECTHVTMRDLTEAEIDAYVASQEWRDKAGGYAIQETADRFVTNLEGGGFDNVVGLPVQRTLELLRRAGAAL